MTDKGEVCPPVTVSFEAGPYMRLGTGPAPRRTIRSIRLEVHNNAGSYWNWILHNIAFEPERKWKAIRFCMPASVLVKIGERDEKIEDERMSLTGRYAPGTRASRRLARYWRNNPR